MKLLNIVIVLALACVPVQSDEVKNLRGEVAPTESGSADVPAKESDLDKDTESEGPSDAVGVPEKELDATVEQGDPGDSTEGAVAEPDAAEAEATEGEEDLMVRTCRRWGDLPRWLVRRHSLLWRPILHPLALS